MSEKVTWVRKCRVETDWSQTTHPLFGLEANNYLQVLKTIVFFLHSGCVQSEQYAAMLTRMEKLDGNKRLRRENIVSQEPAIRGSAQNDNMQKKKMSKSKQRRGKKNNRGTNSGSDKGSPTARFMPFIAIK